MDYETELQLHNRALLAACAISSHEHVLDIGCGTGATTRAAAHLAADGSALGVDIWEPMISRARELAAGEGLRNIRFEHGDAQVHGLQPRHFDIAMSRYGSMFFNDPIAAFHNIRNSLRPDGRIAMMVWQAHVLNEWSVAIHQALAPYWASSSATPDASEHFSFADPGTVERTLSASGFAGTTFRDVREPVYYGASVEAAVEWVRGFRYVRNILQRLDSTAGTQAIERLRETMAKHASERGVWFDAREWIVTAERR